MLPDLKNGTKDSENGRKPGLHTKEVGSHRACTDWSYEVLACTRRIGQLAQHIAENWVNASHDDRRERMAAAAWSSLN